MQPKTVLRLFLILPVLGWVSALLDPLHLMQLPSDSLLTPLIGFPLVIFISSTEFWGIPYAVLAAGLLIWSRKQPVKRVYQALLYSPFLLAPLVIVNMWISILQPEFRVRVLFVEDWINVIWFSLLAAFITLAVGYFFVGIALLLYRAMQRWHIVKLEPEMA